MFNSFYHFGSKAQPAQCRNIFNKLDIMKKIFSLLCATSIATLIGAIPVMAESPLEIKLRKEKEARKAEEARVENEKMAFALEHDAKVAREFSSSTPLVDMARAYVYRVNLFEEYIKHPEKYTKEFVYASMDSSTVLFNTARMKDNDNNTRKQLIEVRSSKEPDPYGKKYSNYNVLTAYDRINYKQPIDAWKKDFDEAWAKKERQEATLKRIEEMSKFASADEFNFYVATHITKESSPQDICRAFEFWQGKLGGRKSKKMSNDYDYLIAAADYAEKLFNFVTTEWSVDEKQLREILKTLPTESAWTSFDSDANVVDDFLDNVRSSMGYQALYNLYVKNVLDGGGAEALHNVSGYIRSSLDKIATCKTVKAKMWFLRQIMHWTDEEIVKQGQVFPTTENLYLNEVKALMESLPKDSIAALTPVFRTAEELDKEHIADREAGIITLKKPKKRDSALEKQIKEYIKKDFPSLSLVDVYSATDATANWNVIKNNIDIPIKREKTASVIINDNEHPGHKLVIDFIITQEYMGGGKYGKSSFEANRPTTEKYLYGCANCQWHFVK